MAKGIRTFGWEKYSGSPTLLLSPQDPTAEGNLSCFSQDLWRGGDTHTPLLFTVRKSLPRSSPIPVAAIKVHLPCFLAPSMKEQLLTDLSMTAIAQLSFFFSSLQRIHK